LVVVVVVMTGLRSCGGSCGTRSLSRRGRARTVGSPADRGDDRGVGRSVDGYNADPYSEVTTDRRMSVAMNTTVNARSNCTPPRFTGLSTRRTGAITGSVSR
jgi:hypothetical protein